MPERIEAPAILIFAPDADDRVAPWHGRKMLAQWQRSSTSGLPVLLRAGREMGHSGGSSVSRMARRHADTWAFFFWQLGVDPA
jgi:prolyl oligopeptidase